ncbi:papain-like cysteine protease family protein [Sphingomonas bacterium]|uniref:papain-like cysteine protease family protein n=1 Tax=Sphingomonas bacterium TaxID=1895847 RepID=UPI0015776D29|nr:papain-like cysteine protease family protein [Sphingomonas bacterium]
MADETPTGNINVFVPGLKLVPQATGNICWWAAALMMYNWKVARGGKVPHPDDEPKNKSRRLSDCILPWDEIPAFADSVGMVARPLISPTPEMLASWLRQGPMWTDGVFVDPQGRTLPSGHMTVLAGLRSVPSSDGYEVFLYDPDPPRRGSAQWRPISQLVSIMGAGAYAAVPCNFLYYQ